MVLEAVFLGMNDAGEKIYEWLNDREEVEVRALLTEKEQLDLVKEIEPDIVFSSGFEHRVPEEIIDVPPRGIINMHPSFLPYNRGSHPYIWPIVEDTPAGVSLHYMSREIDEGPIIDRKEVCVQPDDTAKDLYSRLQEEQFQLFRDNWDDIVNNELDAREQNPGKGRYHYREDLEEIREIDLERHGEFIDRLRALSYPPYPNAYFKINNTRYFVEIDITPEDELEN